MLVATLAYVITSPTDALASWTFADDASRRTFGGLIAQLAGAFAAVFVTLLALAFTLPDRPLLQAMRHSGHFLDLCATMFSAIVGCFIVMVIAAILSIASTPQGVLNLLLCTFFPLALLMFQAGMRFVLTLISVALPS